MSTALVTPDPEPKRSEPSVAVRLFRGLGLLILMVAVAAAAAYAVFEWRVRAEQASVTARVEALRTEALQEVASLKAELTQRQESLQAEMQKVQEAATAAGVLLEKEGEVTGLQARLAEIDTIKLELRKTQEETETKLQGLEQSVRDQVAQSERETAQALSLDVKVKNLLVKAQGEVLLAQIHWSEGNRGMARDELSLAGKTLQQALTEAPEASKPPIKKVVDAAEQTKQALILESSSSRDFLNLLWHQVSDLLAQ